MLDQRFVRQARLPRGAYVKTFKEVVARYRKNNMTVVNPEFNKITQQTSRWHTVRESVPMQKVMKFTIICARCSTPVLKYNDGRKLTARKVEHCGVKDIFFISEELPL